MLAHVTSCQLPLAEIRFDLAQHEGRISALEPHVGKGGALAAWRFSVESLDTAADHLMIVAVADSDEAPDQDTARRLLGLPGEVVRSGVSVDETALGKITTERQSDIQRAISERNARYFEAEVKWRSWMADAWMFLQGVMQ